MKISELSKLPQDTKGIEIHGLVTRVFDPVSRTGKWGAYTTQNFVVKDSTSDVLVSLYNKQIEKTLIDKQVTLSNCSITSYNKDGSMKYVLNMKKDSQIFFDEVTTKTVEDAEEPFGGDTVTPDTTVTNKKKTFAETMLEATLEIHQVMTDDNWKKLFSDCCGADATSEDARAFIISNIISKQRS